MKQSSSVCFVIIISFLCGFQLSLGCPHLKGKYVRSAKFANDSMNRKLQAMPSECALLNGNTLSPTKDGICFVLSVLKPDFEAIVANVGLLQRSAIFGAVLRSVFHDAGEVDLTLPEDTMGPDGCLSDGTDSAGLVEFESPVFTVMEPLWLKWCDKISRADFWVLFAKLVVQFADPSGNFPIQFEYGRVDTHSCNAGSGRLPLPNFGEDELTRVFVDQMGLTLDDAVVLMGAHTVGHTSITNSGYGFAGDNSSGLLNAWDDTPDLFDNHYFSNLMDRNWENVVATDGLKTQWQSVGTETIMLTSDVTLAFDANTTTGRGRVGQVCGPSGQDNGGFGCSPNESFMPLTCNLVCQLAQDNAFFLSSFAAAFTRMTSVGYGVPNSVDGATASGKLGTLTHIDFSTC